MDDLKIQQSAPAFASEFERAIEKVAAQYRGSVLDVLMALLASADASGVCRPSAPMIAREIKIPESRVYSILRRLRADQVIELESGGARGKANGYRLNLNSSQKP